MLIRVDYSFADESSRPVNALSCSDAIAAVQEFPWEQQLALFNQGNDAVGPDVRFARFTHVEETEDQEAYASIAKVEDGTWLIVAGATLPGRFLGFLPVTKKADIILDEITWLDAQNFIERFYQDSRADLFSWMKERDK